MSDLPTGFVPPPGSDIPVTDERLLNAATNFWGYLLEEDYGVKALVSGLTVSDTQNPARPVRVWFDTPEKEERSAHYPYITLRFLNAERDPEREHRGTVPVDFKYLQYSALDKTDGQPKIDYPIPMLLNYIVTTHARSAQHHMQLNAKLQMGPLHPRFGVVVCPGGTTRRLVVVSHSATSGLDPSDRTKRIFRNTYRLQVPSEIEYEVLTGTRVEEVILTTTDSGRGLTETAIIT